MQMKQGTTVGFITVFAAALLATVTAVTANHAATGKGTYDVAPQILAEFHFVVAKSVDTNDTNPELKPGLNFVQSETARIRGSKPLRTAMISTAIEDPFTISSEPAGRTVTIRGQMVSTTFPGEGQEGQPFAELVSFTATGVDTVTSAAGPDLFSLIVEYSADKDQGALFASLGFGDCDGPTYHYIQRAGEKGRYFCPHLRRRVRTAATPYGLSTLPWVVQPPVADALSCRIRL